MACTFWVVEEQGRRRVLAGEVTLQVDGTRVLELTRPAVGTMALV